MKKISVLSLSLTFAGCFLGAGYVSGQEIYQFFGAFGKMGVVGLLFAVATLWALGLLLVRQVARSGDDAIDRTIVGSDNPVLLFLVGAVEIVMMFGTYIVMVAGAGALIEQVTGFAGVRYAGGLIFAFTLSFIAIHGINGLIRLFSYAVPALVIFTVFIGVFSLVRSLPEGLVFVPREEVNPLLPTWKVGFVTFAAYNFFCCVGVMCPVGKRIRSKRQASVGLAVGALLLFLVAVGVLLSIAGCPGAAEEQIPMLAAAESVSPAIMYLYALLLLCAMTGAGLSCLIPTVTYFSRKSRFCEKHAAALMFAVSLVAYLLSCFGFSDLVGTLFSAFGYVSVLLIVGLIRNYIVTGRKNKHS